MGAYRDMLHCFQMRPDFCACLQRIKTFFGIPFDGRLAMEEDDIQMELRNVIKGSGDYR